MERTTGAIKAMTPQSTRDELRRLPSERYRGGSRRALADAAFNALPSLLSDSDQLAAVANLPYEMQLQVRDQGSEFWDTLGAVASMSEADAKEWLANASRHHELQFMRVVKVTTQQIGERPPINAAALSSGAQPQ